MKKLILFVAVLILGIFGNQAFSQNIKAQDSKVKIDKVERPAISVSSEAEINDITDAWASYLKKNFKLKVDKSNNAVMALAASVPDISAAAFDLNATFEKSAGGCEMLVTGALGYDIYFSPKEHSEEYRKLKGIVEEFVRNFMAEKFDEMIKDRQKEVDASIKDQEKMENDILKLQKDIEEANQTIEKLKLQIEENTASIKTNTEALPALKERVEKEKILLQELISKKLNATGK